jgi:predicted membrane channel-forming protein YqfA (hemolysin III family)
MNMLYSAITILIAVTSLPIVFADVSLLTVVIVVAAFLIAGALIALLDKFLGEKIGYPRWFVHMAYGLLALIVVLYLCKEFGVFQLLNSVRV